MMNSKKIVVASVPFTETSAPMMAPALLKGILNSAGFECTAIDLNGQVCDRIANEADYDSYLRFFYHELVDLNFDLKIKKIFDDMTDQIMSHNPDIVCLSLLHYQCQISTRWLCFCLKKINPLVKIIIGGAGAFGSGLLTNEETFVSKLKNQKLIDHYISGDGDLALIELINGNLDYPGIDSLSWKPIENLNVIAYPDYDDYDFNVYKSPFIGILGSRGCVRQCTFCDIHEYWEKFKWRTGENIFNEMLIQNKKYKTRYFKFQDSLINGNVKEYNNLISLLATHNNQNPDNAFHWVSYFILRPANQMSEEQWSLLSQSGAIRLSIGIESLVEKNRNHIKKKFSNEDIDFGLKMAKKYNVGVTFLMMTGYVTETEEDHVETLKWLEDNAHYANQPIVHITLGGSLAILPGTYLARHQSELGVVWKDGPGTINSGNNHLWEIVSTGNTYETRLRRLNEIIEVGTKNGFSVQASHFDPQKELENVIKEKMNNEYYSN